MKTIFKSVFLLSIIVLSGKAMAGCYAIPFQHITNIGSASGARFEATINSCPGVNTSNYEAEICVAVEGTSNYNSCSGYQEKPYSSSPWFSYSNVRLYNAYGRYTYRLRYRKTDGSMGVGVYGPVQGHLYGSSSGGGTSSSSSGSSSSGSSCPPPSLGLNIPGCP